MGVLQLPFEDFAIFGIVYWLIKKNRQHAVRGILTVGVRISIWETDAVHEVVAVIVLSRKPITTAKLNKSISWQNRINSRFLVDNYRVLHLRWGSSEDKQKG